MSPFSLCWFILLSLLVNLNLVFSCPKNWILINSKCFLINKAPDSYVNNLNLCKKQGAFLVHDLNLNDLERLSRFIEKSAWIGHQTNFTLGQPGKFENNCIYLNKKEGILFNERCQNEHAQLCYKQSILDTGEEDNNEVANPLERLFSSGQTVTRRGLSLRKKLFRFGKKNKTSYKLEMINQSMNKIESELSSLKRQLKQISKEKWP